MANKKTPKRVSTAQEPRSWTTTKIQRAAVAAIMRENQSRIIQIIQDVKEDLGLPSDVSVQFPQTAQGIDLTTLVEVLAPRSEPPTQESDDAA